MNSRGFPKREKGLTFLGFVFVFGLFGFFTTLLLRIGPVYLEHFKVKSTLESLKSDSAITSKSREEIIGQLLKRWEINMIDSVSKDDIKIVKQGDYLKVEIAYDVVKNAMGNVDVIIHFDDEIEVGAN
jgi:hypothetical protein